MKNHRNLIRTILSVCLVCLVATGGLLAQGRRGGPGPRFVQGEQVNHDPLAFLKQALSRSGATALSSTQEQQLNALISAFQASRSVVTPDPAIQAARDNYDNAILSGSTSATKAAAEQLARALAVRQQAELEAQGTFQAQAFSVLQNDQVAALVNKIGKGGLVRVLASLAGRFGMRGGPGPNMPPRRQK